MAVRCAPKDDWFVEEYSDCQRCGCDKPFSEDWYCATCNKAIKKEQAECMNDKEQARLATIGLAVEKGFRELRASIPCMGVYQSKPCQAVENDTSRCVLKYFCELQATKDGV